jgi:hypothetical protein
LGGHPSFAGTRPDDEVAPRAGFAAGAVKGIPIDRLDHPSDTGSDLVLKIEYVFQCTVAAIGIK